MNITQIIWDWNGTLLDDVAVNYAVVNQMLQENGHPPLASLAQYREIFCFPIQNFYRAAGFDFADATFEQLAARYMQLYLEQSKESVLFPRARQVLSIIKEKGIRQSILSASMHSCLKEQFARLGVEGYFDTVLARTDALAHSKVEIGRSWLASTGANPETMLMIGDTAHDYETATALGCHCVLIAAGHESKTRLEQVPCPVVDSIWEVLNG